MSDQRHEQRQEYSRAPMVEEAREQQREQRSVEEQREQRSLGGSVQQGSAKAEGGLQSGLSTTSNPRDVRTDTPSTMVDKTIDPREVDLAGLRNVKEEDKADVGLYGKAQGTTRTSTETNEGSQAMQFEHNK